MLIAIVILLLGMLVLYDVKDNVKVRTSLRTPSRSAQMLRQALAMDSQRDQ